MKKLFLTGIICFLTTSAFAADKQPKWMDSQNWTQLQKWMSPLQVNKILGNPLYKDFNAQAGIWYFQDAPQIEGTKITRPDYGLVRFRRIASGGYVVLDWKEPDWDKLALLLAEKEKLKAEQGPTPEEIEAARIEAERLAEEKRIAEEKARQAELQRQRELQKQKEAEKFNWLERKNLYTGGGILLAIIAIYIVFSKSYS
jgi:hypothetical protein